MKKILVLLVLVLFTGCAKAPQPNPASKKPPMQMERNQTIYIALPTDLGDHKDDYLERVHGSSEQMGTALKKALAPYALNIILGNTYGESEESALQNATNLGARYLFRLDGRGYLVRPVLWRRSESGVTIILFVTDLAPKSTISQYQLKVRIYRERGYEIPVSAVINEMMPKSFAGAAASMFQD